MTKRKQRPPEWRAVSLLTLAVVRQADRRMLALLVDVSDFTIVAFETGEPPRGATGLEAAAAVFGSHAHKVVGQGTSLAQGVALAELYASAWVESDEAAERCRCGEIGNTGGSHEESTHV